MPKDNVLWEKHRIYLPEMRELATHLCRDCKFCVDVKGKDEVRKACIVNIRTYAKLRKKIPQVIPIIQILKLSGTEGLDECLRCNPENQSCGKFILRV